MWISPKYRTLAVPVSLAQTIELFTHVFSGVTINIIPDKEQKYRTVRLNTGHLATLSWSKDLEWTSSRSKAPPKRCLFSIPPPSKDCSFLLGLGRERLWIGILKGRYINLDWLIDNCTGAVLGNNLESLYQLSSVYVGRNWVDQWSLITQPQVNKFKSA